MNKRFNLAFFIAFFLIVALFMGTVLYFDPMYHYHKPAEGLPLRLNNGRYQNAGVARHFDYNAILTGTSVSANFSTDQLDRLFGLQSVKLIVLDGYLSDFDTTLDVALSSRKDIGTVFWGIDSNILGRGEEKKTVELPAYLYNNNPFDDVEYLLNKYVMYDVLELLEMRKEGVTDTINDAFFWSPGEWSRDKAIAGYPRPEVSEEVAPDDYFIENAKMNLQTIRKHTEGNPDTTFYLYMVPYSTLYWDKAVREGQLKAVVEMHRYVLKQLSEIENVKLYYFMDHLDIVTNLFNYGDHIHFSPDVNDYMADYMAANPPVDPLEIDARLDALYAFLKDYHYDSVFPGYKPSVP